MLKKTHTQKKQYAYEATCGTMFYHRHLKGKMNGRLDLYTISHTPPHTSADTHTRDGTLGILFTRGCAQWNTLNQHSIISVLGCQRLWERATAHSSGGSLCLLQKAHEVHYRNTSSSSQHILNQKKSYHGHDSTPCILHSKGIFLLLLPEAHLPNSSGES